MEETRLHNPLDTPGREGSVLLLSGGIESATLLHRKGRVHPLFIDYGQRAAAREGGGTPFRSGNFAA